MVEINKVLRALKIAIIGLTSYSILTSSLLLYYVFRSSLVIVKSGENKSYHYPTRKKDKLTTLDIENFVKEFIRLRYQFRNYSSEEVLKNIRPLTTNNFQKVLRGNLNKNKDKLFKGKKLSQSITELKVIVTKKSILAKFYKVLTVDGVPFPVIPTEIKLRVFKDTPTKWNPRGLYVNGVTEHNEN